MNIKDPCIKAWIFPDGQPHVNVTFEDSIDTDEGVRVICSIDSSNTLLKLAELSEALDTIFAQKSELIIPYLMGARSDRVMTPGDSFDLKVISRIINSCGFKKVYLYDVHSDVATALIHNSINMDNKELVDLYTAKDSILIIPDAGAAKKAYKYLEWNKNIVDTVQCVKHRDLSTGNITLEVIQPEKCLGRNCVIIDDLCDGGGTFIAIADRLNGACKRLALIVTHGIFSKGLESLRKRFDHIITSDSYPHGHGEETYITVLKHNYGTNWSYGGYYA